MDFDALEKAIRNQDYGYLQNVAPQEMGAINIPLVRQYALVRAAISSGDPDLLDQVIDNYVTQLWGIKSQTPTCDNHAFGYIKYALEKLDAKKPQDNTLDMLGELLDRLLPLPLSVDTYDLTSLAMSTAKIKDNNAFFAATQKLVEFFNAPRLTIENTSIPDQKNPAQFFLNNVIDSIKQTQDFARLRGLYKQRRQLIGTMPALEQLESHDLDTIGTYREKAGKSGVFYSEKDVGHMYDNMRSEQVSLLLAAIKENSSPELLSKLTDALESIYRERHKHSGNPANEKNAFDFLALEESEIFQLGILLNQGVILKEPYQQESPGEAPSSELQKAHDPSKYEELLANIRAELYDRLSGVKGSTVETGDSNRVPSKIKAQLSLSIIHHKSKNFGALLSEFDEIIKNDSTLMQKLAEEAAIAGNADALIQLSRHGIYPDYFSVVMHAVTQKRPQVIDAVAKIMEHNGGLLPDELKLTEIIKDLLECNDPKNNAVITSLIKLALSDMARQARKSSATENEILESQHNLLEELAFKAIHNLSPQGLRLILTESRHLAHPSEARHLHEEKCIKALQFYHDECKEVANDILDKGSRNEISSNKAKLNECETILKAHAINLMLTSENAAEQDDQITKKLLELKKAFEQRSRSEKLDHQPFEYIDITEKTMANYLVRLKNALKNHAAQNSAGDINDHGERQALMTELAQLAFSSTQPLSPKR